MKRELLVGWAGDDVEAGAAGAPELELLDVAGRGDDVVVRGHEEGHGRARVEVGDGVKVRGVETEDAGDGSGGGADDEPWDAGREVVADAFDGGREARVGGDGDGGVEGGVLGDPAEGEGAAEGDAEDDDRPRKRTRMVEVPEERVEVRDLGGAEGDASAGGAPVSAEVHEDGMPAEVGAEEGPREHGALGETVAVEEHDGAEGLLEAIDGRGGDLSGERELGHGAAAMGPVGGEDDGPIGGGRDNPVGKARGIAGQDGGGGGLERVAREAHDDVGLEVEQHAGVRGDPVRVGVGGAEDAMGEEGARGASAEEARGERDQECEGNPCEGPWRLHAMGIPGDGTLAKRMLSVAWVITWNEGIKSWDGRGAVLGHSRRECGPSWGFLRRHGRRGVRT